MTAYEKSLLIELDHLCGLDPNCAERGAKLVWFVKVSHVIERCMCDLVCACAGIEASPRVGCRPCQEKADSPIQHRTGGIFLC
jgi:hypothetical protein